MKQTIELRMGYSPAETEELVLSVLAVLTARNRGEHLTAHAAETFQRLEDALYPFTKCTDLYDLEGER